MKISKIYPFLLSALFLIVVLSCNEEDRDTTFADGIVTPSNLSILVQITQDNTGTVTLTPSGESVALYTIDFGDGSEVASAQPGESFEHVYQEGSYTATLTGTNLSGETASISQEIVVSFLPPENLQVNITPVSGDAFSILLSATADLATGFEVFFGEDPNQEAVPLMLGESTTYTYANIGVYDVRVVALAGSSATIEIITQVTIENPITLPIDFESATIEYNFIDFGGAITTLIDNPDPSGINTSGHVAQFFKETGAEVFAGTVIELGAPIDFSTFQGFTIKSWSPTAGLTVKLKLENGTDPNISAEIDATTTSENEWEALNFDFTGLTDAEYSKVIVFYDFGNPGDGSIFYFDDIIQSDGSSGGGGSGIELPIDFELPIDSYDFLGFEGADSAIEMNPDMSGENTSANVMRSIKTVGAQFFAGTFIDTDVAIDFSSTGKLAIKTWSPKANIPIRMAIENQNTGNQIFVDVNTTVANTWETLEFDFTTLIDSNVDYNRVVVFFEFVVDLPGDGTTYYFDDIELTN